MHDVFSRRDCWTPEHFQYQTTECGVAALGMILAHHGRDVPLEEIRAATGVSRDCLNAADVVAGAREFGLDVKVRTCEPERLPDLGFPSIVHLKFIHFVVIEGMTDTHVLLNDPHQGRSDVSRAHFNETFTGVVLNFSPSEDFQSRKAEPDRPLSGIMATRAEWAILVGSSIAHCLAIAALIGSVLAISEQDWTTAGMTAMAMLIAHFWRGALFGLLGVQLSGRIRSTLVRHVLKLRSDVVTYRIPNNMSDTIQSADRMTDILCRRLLPTWLDLAAIPCLLLAIGHLHPASALTLGAVVVLLCVANRLALTWLETRKGSDITDGSDPMQGIVNDIANPRSWKFGGRDRTFITGAMGWQARQALNRLERYPGDLAVGIVSAIAVPLILSAAVLGLRHGSDTPAPPLSDLPTLGVLLLTLTIALTLQRLRETRGQWRRFRRIRYDIHDLMAAPVMDETSEPTAETSGLRRPALQLENVIFGYSPRKPALLNGISLHVGTGEQLGITGPSGGGKSTVGRILAGLNTPWSGSAMLHGQSMQIGHQPGWIGKATVFFEASLRENLTLWDQGISDATILAAMRCACVDGLLHDRPDGLDTRVEPQGRNFSGGQLQRLEIARAVLLGSKVLILDEALDAMNPSIETQLRQNLRESGYTVVVISHRASTLNACDRLVTLVDGRVAEGTHNDRHEGNQPSGMHAVIDRDGPRDASISSPPLSDLEYAFNAVCRQQGLNADNQGETLPELSDSSNVLFRRNRFISPDWWQYERPPLIALPGNQGTACMWMAGDGIPAGMPPAIPAESAQLYDASPPMQDGGPGTMVAGALWFGRRDVLRALVAGLLSGVALVIWPMLLNPSGTSPGPQIWAILALVLAGFGLAAAAGTSATVRLCISVERSVLHLLLKRCRFKQAAPLSKMPRERIASALESVPTLARLIQSELMPTTSAIGTILATTGLIAFQSTGAALTTLAGCLLLITATTLTGRVASQCQRIDDDAAKIEDRHLRTLLNGLSRLRSLESLQRVATNWSQDRANRQGRQAGLRYADACEDAIRAAGPVAALSLVLMLSFEGLDTALAAMLALTASIVLARCIVTATHGLGMLGDLRELATGRQETGAEIVGTATPVQARNVCFDYAGVPVLKGVTALVKPGSVTVLAGASGSGKSTLLTLLLGLDTPTAGDVVYGTQLMTGLNLSLCRRKIGVVFQGDHLQQAGTLRSHLSGLEPADVAEVWRILELVELARDVEAMPMGLQSIVDSNLISTGQMQRLFIGRQLVSKPEILVLDEAMNAVPDAMQARLLKNFRELGLTCLIVTHRASTIELADHVIVLEQGEVAYDGPPGPVLARPEFRSSLRAESNAGY